MSTTTAWHTIREASMISGLPESTLRYYEQIGIGA
ncbi:MerR family DNA-binding transcriptional regulator [Bifidobacterium longum]|nr:MerR family DNA-binding transcriptional regulator [Bifidobacterium longum]